MKALVTGGGGFLGYAIVKMLRQQGADVHTLCRNSYPKLTDIGAVQYQGDLCDYAAVVRAATGCDIVFHVGAKAGIWGDYADYYSANVTGTDNVIKACCQLNINKLIYTSSPSVVFTGQSMAGLNETLPYPKHYETAYPATKAIAEQHVIAANTSQLATVALRPHLIWGPGDNQLIPRIIARGRKGKLRKIGKQEHLVDCIYVDNAAYAHILAAQKLVPNAVIAGQCYFISQDDPRNLWDIVNAILASADIAPVTQSIPFNLAYSVGWLLEKYYRCTQKNSEPPMTRFLARELSTAHWFDISKAKNELGYLPQITIEAGMETLRLWLKNSQKA